MQKQVSMATQNTQASNRGVLSQWSVLGGWRIGGMSSFSLFVSGLLIVIGLSTNHLLIFNEEILIAVAFFGFVFFTQRFFGQSLRSELEEHRSKLELELESVLSHREEALAHQMKKEQKKAERKAHVQQIDTFASTCERSLPKVLNENLHRRLQQIVDVAYEPTASKFEKDLQEALVQNLRSQVVYKIYARPGSARQR
jgi:F0F1-type ATP synthase membrane subunit b/b'